MYMTGGLDMSRRTWTLLAMSLATFMTYLDNNIVNVAIPTIQRDLRLSASGLEWVVSSYLLALAGLLLAGGRLADVYGRRRVFLAGLTIFTLSSLAAGLAGSGDLLVASRAVQGLGAALQMPATLAMLQATFTDHRERRRAIGIWGAVGALALAVGPAAGGLISEHARWGWIFLINVPVGVVTFAITLAAAAESRGHSASRRLDLPGLATSSAALFALTYALIDGQARGWTSAPILAAIATAAACLGAFLAIEARSAHPMVPLSMFRHRVFSGGSATMMGWSFGVMGIYFYTSVYLQSVLGFSPVKAGLLFVPMAVLLAVAALVSGRVISLIGAHRATSLGLVVMLSALLVFSTFGTHASLSALTAAFLLYGLGAGLMTVPLTVAVLGATPPERGGVASALLNESRQVAGLLGITVVGAVLRSVQADSSRRGVGAPDAFLAGYHAGLYLTIAVIAACAVISYLTLRPRIAPAEPAPPAPPARPARTKDLATTNAGR
jgi:EmrB/QacA subfamily drug resistance transporter